MQRCINQTAHSPPASHKERVWNQKEQGIKSTWSASNMLAFERLCKGTQHQVLPQRASSPPTLQALGMFLLLQVSLFLRKVSVIYVIFLSTYPKGKKKQKFVCKRSTFRLPEMEEAHLTDEKLSCPQRGQDSLFHPLLASSTFSVSHLKLFGKLCRQKTSLLKFTKRTWRVKKLPDY